MKNHDTLVLGFKDGKVVFFRAFDFKNEKEAALEAYRNARDTMEGGVIGHVTGWYLKSTYADNDPEEAIYSFDPNSFPLPNV